MTHVIKSGLKNVWNDLKKADEMGSLRTTQPIELDTNGLGWIIIDQRGNCCDQHIFPDRIFLTQEQVREIVKFAESIRK